MKVKIYEGTDPSTGEKFEGTLDYKFFDVFLETIVMGLIDSEGNKKEFSSSHVVCKK